MLSTPRVTDEIFKATPFNEYKGIIDREETYLEALGEQFDLLGSNSICSHFMETIGFQLQPLWKRLGCNFSPRFLLVCRKCAIWIPANYMSKIIDDIPFLKNIGTPILEF